VALQEYETNQKICDHCGSFENKTMILLDEPAHKTSNKQADKNFASTAFTSA